MKQIVISGKNAAENIRLSRLATRKSNLVEDKCIWEVLAKTPCSNLLPITTTKGNKLVKDAAFKTAMAVGSTITKRIVTRYADEFGVLCDEDVSAQMIQEIAARYLAWDYYAQLLVCRDPSRQSIDEEVQIETLRRHLKHANVVKLTNGSVTLFDGRLISKPKDTKFDARSVDFQVLHKGIVFNIFAKYSLVSGSGQSHQAIESKNFILEAAKYIRNTHDNAVFVVMLDGAEAERHIAELQAISNSNRIFVGNSEMVINFVNTYL